jgi:hypothetical protein
MRFWFVSLLDSQEAVKARLAWLMKGVPANLSPAPWGTADFSPSPPGGTSAGASIPPDSGP